MPIGIAMPQRSKYNSVLWAIINTVAILLTACLGARKGEQMSDLAVRYRAATLFVAAAFIACTLHGQVTSRISGYVKDSSGAVIPRAEVTAVSVEQKLTRIVNSDNTGYYELVAIPAGSYDIDVAAPGFQHQTQTNVGLQVNQTLRLDVELR